MAPLTEEAPWRRYDEDRRQPAARQRGDHRPRRIASADHRGDQGAGKLGDEKSGPCHAVLTPDGNRAFVTRDGDHTLSMLKLDDKLSDTGQRIKVNGGPAGIRTAW